MPEKKDAYATPAIKALRLYILLLFSGRAFSLTELAHKHRCSKQTIMRMMEQIKLSDINKVDSWVDDEGRRYYRAVSPPIRPKVSLDVEDIRQLLLCRDIVWHLLPPAFREEISRTIAHTTVLLQEFEKRAEATTPFARAHSKGTIDYAPFQKTLEQALEAIAKTRICELRYRRQPGQKHHDFQVAPLKLIAYRDGFYLKCRLEKALDKPGRFFDPMLAVHRIEKFQLTHRSFKAPEDVEGETSRNFGFIAGDLFKARVAFGPEVATYVAERKWSDDQKLTRHRDGSIVLKFTASSRQEVISWVLSFGKEAELLAPGDLRQEFMELLEKMNELYKRAVPPPEEVDGQLSLSF